MKSLKFLITLLIITLTGNAIAQTEKEENNSGDFFLTVVGFESDEGKAMIALFNSEEAYSENGEKFKYVTADIKDSKAEWAIEDLPFGEYAIKLYHDENENRKLDRNMLGIPSETFGFSNNATGSFGPADYEDTKFIFNSSGQKHEINLN